MVLYLYNKKDNRPLLLMVYLEGFVKVLYVYLYHICKYIAVMKKKLLNLFPSNLCLRVNYSSTSEFSTFTFYYSFLRFVYRH